MNPIIIPILNIKDLDQIIYDFIDSYEIIDKFKSVVSTINLLTDANVFNQANDVKEIIECIEYELEDIKYLVKDLKDYARVVQASRFCSGYMYSISIQSKKIALRHKYTKKPIKNVIGYSVGKFNIKKSYLRKIKRGIYFCWLYTNKFK